MPEPRTVANPPSNKWISVKAAADLLGHNHTMPIYRLIEKGRLRTDRIDPERLSLYGYQTGFILVLRADVVKIGEQE